jgi:hypothetical protein
LRGYTKEYEGENGNHVEWLSQALSKTPVPEDITVFRGVSKDALGGLQSLPPEQLIGKIIGDKGFMSTSLVPTGAFISDLTLIIQVPKGTHGAFVGHVTNINKRWNCYWIRDMK